MNFTTDLPKNNSLCSYLVATGRVEEECYRMHVVVNSQEYNHKYRDPDVLKQLKSKIEDNGGSKLLPEDRYSNSERIILCHCLRID